MMFIRSRVGFLVLSAVCFVTAGCSRIPESTFVARQSLADLPELHQEDIDAGLRSMFGTPTRPRIRLSIPAAAEDNGEENNATERDDAPQETETVSILDPSRLTHGAGVYQRRCAGCHGASGDGQGPAAEYLRPKPRDYRDGVFKFTSTSYGARPARQDLVRTIRRGAKGTSMPAFPWMSQPDLDAVVDYVIYLVLRGRVEADVEYMADDYDEDESIPAEEFADAIESEIERWESAALAVIDPVSAEPAYNKQSVSEGRRLFIKSSCYSCHGIDAKGQTEWLSAEFLAAQEQASDGESIKINYDAWGEPAPAANITARMLHGGRRPLDIYRRIYTGINGTPMPQFGQLFADNPDAIWHLVHYVMHIVGGGDPSAGISLADVQSADAAATGDEAADGASSEATSEEETEEQDAAEAVEEKKAA